MYTVDDGDEVRELFGIPHSSPGAPHPIVVASEDRVLFAYLVHRDDAVWDGDTPRVIDRAGGEPARR